MALARGALGIQIEQLRSGVVGALRGFLLCLVPLTAAELVQRRLLRRCATVAADEMQARDRDIKLGVVRVEQMQELVGAVAQVGRGEPEIAADAVLLVHHRIADAHLRQVAQHGVDVRAAAFAFSRAARDSGIELALGDDRDVALGPDEACVQRAYRERGA